MATAPLVSSLTLADRAQAFRAAFPDCPDAWPYVSPSGRWLYGHWEVGNNYRATTTLYGAYPPGYLARVMALFPDVTPSTSTVLHVFSGSLPPGPYLRLDVHAGRQPDVVGDVCAVEQLLHGARFDLIIGDPPYSAEDAVRYGTTMPDRRQVLIAIAGVTAPGGHLVWLDTVSPMFCKRDWLAVGKIALHRSTNHRERTVFIFQKAAA